MPKTTRHGGGTNAAAAVVVTYPKGPAGPMVGEQGPEIVEVPEGTVQVGDRYSAWTNDELRAELGKRDLPTDGNKAKLVARLLGDDTAPDAGE